MCLYVSQSWKITKEPWETEDRQRVAKMLSAQDFPGKAGFAVSEKSKKLNIIKHSQMLLVS